MPSTRSSTSSTTEPRSRLSTFAPTSMRRDCCSRSMAFGVGAIRTSATSLSLIRVPLGVSSGRFSTSVTLLRALGMAVTCTSYARPPE